MGTRKPSRSAQSSRGTGSVAARPATPKPYRDFTARRIMAGAYTFDVVGERGIAHPIYSTVPEAYYAAIVYLAALRARVA